METAIEKRDIQRGLQLCSEINQIDAQGPYEIGIRCREIKEKNEYPLNDTYEHFIAFHTKYKSLTHINRLIAFSRVVDNLGIEVHQMVLPPEAVLRPLKKLRQVEDQRAVWQEVSSNGTKPTGDIVAEAVEKKLVSNAQPKTKKNEPTKLVFNWTSERVDWARWTWNPVCGCKRGCPYCYASDFAKRQHKDFTKPELLMHKLVCPKNTQIPDDKKGLEGIRNVFVCSMSDLFGEWIPEDWITKVFNACRDNPQWNYIFLTKNPKRLTKYEWPDNWWVGTTVDCQDRVAVAEEVFSQVAAKVKFVSIEPFNEPISFSNLNVFNWVIIGGRSVSSGMPAFQPEWKWVVRILVQAIRAGCKVYKKPNLPMDIKEYPSA